MNYIAKLLKSLRAKVRHILIGHLSYEHLNIEKQIEELKLVLGRQEERVIANSKYRSIQDAEFKIFSQFGEDGIIQYLISKINIPNKIFVELGVGNYEESNTKFLLMNNNWSGKIVNSGTEHIDYLNSDKGKVIKYKFDIEAYSEFITSQNVNSILKKMNLPKDIGIISIDLDGVDYWIWKEINVISPRIVIVEYNSNFGPDMPITVPYKSDFDRTNEHFSNLYFGTSLSALCLLAKSKGYVFVGSNSAGLNAFFVRKDVSKGLPNISAKSGYTKNLFRESKNERGELTFVNDRKQRLELIKSKKVFNIKTQKLSSIKDAFKL